jgi:hypothetical protein
MTIVRIKTTLPALPPSPPPIFKLPAPVVNARVLLQLAARFKLRARERDGRIARDATTLSYAEGPFELTLHRASGAFRFVNRARWQVDHRSNVGLSDDQAVTLARDQLQQADLLPKESRVLRVSRLHVATAGPDRVMQDRRVVDVAVHLQPIIRGLPADGPGGKVTVYLDHEQQVTCVDHVVRAVGPVYREVERLHPPEHAVDAARRRWSARGVAEGEVNEVRLCYFEMGWNDRQRYLQPAYIVMGTLIGADRRIRTGDIYVSPAAVNSIGRIVPSSPRPIAQQPRPERGSPSPQEPTR